ncbi:MAG: hypothetical protein IJ348_07645 [Alistipes sp.]|nr:hypothetical protein [Alistipes sp.]
MRVVICILAVLLCWGRAEACSSAIVAARASKEGGVILWKHRDQTTTRDTRVAYFDDGKYPFTALVNSYHSKNTVYGGLNSEGLGIISTATKNLKQGNGSGTDYTQSNYGLMGTALRECATVEEFEALLSKYPRRADFQSNIGVGDSQGGAAYFEIWGDGYRRYDVDKRAEGYDIRTNFSFAGRDSERGASERRYRTVQAQMRGRRAFAVEDFVGYSRSFFSADKGDILADDKPHREANYIVPRPSSIACIVIVCGSNPHMEIAVGHPVATFTVPVWVAAQRDIPHCIAGRGMFDLSSAFVAKAYEREGKATYLNKPLVRKVLKVKTCVPAPQQMPKDIVAFNAKVDKIFEKHRRKIMNILE